MKVTRTYSCYGNTVTYSFTIKELREPSFTLNQHALTVTERPREGEKVKIRVDCAAEKNISDQQCCGLLNEKNILDTLNQLSVAHISLQRITGWFHNPKSVNVNTHDYRVEEVVTPKKAAHAAVRHQQQSTRVFASVASFRTFDSALNPAYKHPDRQGIYPAQ